MSLEGLSKAEREEYEAKYRRYRREIKSWVTLANQRWNFPVGKPEQQRELELVGEGEDAVVQVQPGQDQAQRQVQDRHPAARAQGTANYRIKKKKTRLRIPAGFASLGLSIRTAAGSGARVSPEARVLTQEDVLNNNNEFLEEEDAPFLIRPRRSEALTKIPTPSLSQDSIPTAPLSQDSIATVPMLPIASASTIPFDGRRRTITFVPEVDVMHFDYERKSSQCLRLNLYKYYFTIQYML